MVRIHVVYKSTSEPRCDLRLMTFLPNRLFAALPLYLNLPSVNDLEKKMGGWGGGGDEGRDMNYSGPFRETH